MDAAEKRFSAYGCEGASIRAVNAATGRAPMAVHHHFRTKKPLLEAVVPRRGKLAARRATELIEALDADPRAPTVRRAFPDAQKEELETAWHISSGIIILMLRSSATQMLAGGGSGKQRSKLDTGMLVDLVSAGLAHLLECNRRAEARTLHRDPKNQRLGPDVRRRGCGLIRRLHAVAVQD